MQIDLLRYSSTCTFLIVGQKQFYSKIHTRVCFFMTI